MQKLLSPDRYELGIAYMARPSAEQIQLDLILDYLSNVAYPAFQSYQNHEEIPQRSTPFESAAALVRASVGSLQIKRRKSFILII